MEEGLEEVTIKVTRVGWLEGASVELLRALFQNVEGP